MFKSSVYHGNLLIGEVEVHPMSPMITGARIREIRITHFSPPSERCPPLAVLHTIAPAGVSFTMESAAPTNDSPLWSLHSACIRENKTAVVPLGAHELHLVAMQSRKNLMQYSCFWGFYVAPSLYSSCLVMLNLRCLGIVFDLDETLIVANTMRSFEDKIDALQRKVNNEVDPQRVTGMMAEIKRYQDDKSILKQYIENDQVVENGKAFEVKSEVVPPLSDNHQFITRPIIRLQEKNIILTRVNPEIRDTSVLVRLRPAWEDLRSYLTAKGRKRFEVYVCTMAERDYAIEMWRLLDPEAKLISSRELLDRIVCVKSGYRKSLLSVFQEGNCHPKMSLVIDDRLKVWDEKDQSRVHVVPAFAPYYAPQAEANSSVPVLCVARNVACNVRGGFFKDFDEVFLPRIAEVFYEGQMTNFQSSPDVGKYLSEDDTSASNGNKDPQCNGSMADVEMEKKLKDANYCAQAVLPVVNNFDSRSISSLQHAMASSFDAVPLTATQVMMPLPNNQCLWSITTCRVLGQPGLSEPSLQGSLATEEGEVRESELDPDMRRRLLILQHGQDTRHPPPPPPFSVRPPPLQVSVPPVQSCGSWYPSEEEIIPRQLKRMAKEFPLEPEAVHFKRKRSHHSSSYHKGDNFIPSDRLRYENQGLQVHHEDDWLRSNNSVTNYRSSPGGEMPLARVSSEDKDRQSDSGSSIPHYAETPASALQEIAMKCGTKVEFRAALFDTAELRFSVEVWFHGEKIGEGIGHTRKEAQNQAADRSLRNLANEYLSSTLVDSTAVREDFTKLSHVKENGFISDSNSFGYPRFTKGDQLPYGKTLEEPLPFDNRLKGSKNTTAIVTALKELCTTDGYSLVFQEHPSPSISSVGRADVYAQVEIAGQILGKGSGTTWEEAKNQAAEEAFETLTSMRGQFTQKHSGSPRSLRAAPNKRWKQDFMPRIPSSGRYLKKEAPVP